MRKRKIARNNIEKSGLRDETEIYKLEETTIKYILFEIGELLAVTKY
ncbi:MAG TPA: hypothetical protein VFK40_04310 [Nitrososphaeraceae archaeon]|nr:hypothetical protein [Nitrososphaeraceae archaeon]